MLFTCLFRSGCPCDARGIDGECGRAALSPAPNRRSGAQTGRMRCGRAIPAGAIRDFRLPSSWHRAERASRLSSSEAVTQRVTAFLGPRAIISFLNVRRFDKRETFRVTYIYNEFAANGRACRGLIQARSCRGPSGWHLAVGGCVDQAIQRRPERSGGNPEKRRRQPERSAGNPREAASRRDAGTRRGAPGIETDPARFSFCGHSFFLRPATTGFGAPFLAADKHASRSSCINMVRDLERRASARGPLRPRSYGPRSTYRSAWRR